jgi:hypothetical protein
MKKTIFLLFFIEVSVMVGFSSALAQAKTISQTSGNAQTETISTPLTQPFVVTITDSLGAPVAGVAVNFTVVGSPLGASGQNLSVSSTTTDLNGQASTVLTLGSKVGTYSVTATSAGLIGSPVGFTATATAGPPKNLTLTSGNGQSGQVTTALANPFVVTVTDVGGNPVSGKSVTFAVATFPSGAIGQTLSLTADISDANGLASTILTLGTKGGTYTVTATSSGLTGSPVTFTATGTPASATQVRVETAADGTGVIVLPQSLPSGSTLTGYAITRDVYDNFIANVAADSWTVINTTLGVTVTDLVASGDSKSATFTGHLVGTGLIQATEGLLTKIPSGTITITAGTATKVRVETRADGAGKVVPDTSLPSGSALTGYAISRDALNNFVTNVAADTWALLSKTGGVVDGDLVASGDRRSAVFTGHVMGSAQIQATLSGLTPSASGTVSVTAGPDARVQVETKSDGTGVVVPAQSLASGNLFTVYSIVRDASGNFKSNVAATAWQLTGKVGGVVDGDLVASGDKKSAVFTGHVIGSAQIQATSGALSVTPSGIVTVTAGTAAKLRIETVANGNGVVFPAESLPSGTKDTAYAITRDASDNFVANVAADAGSWSLVNKTGSVVDGDLVPSGDRKSAVFTAHATGSAQIHAASGALPVTNGGVITVTVGTATKIRVENKADGTGTVIPDQTLLASRSITVYAISRDTADNFVANVAATAWSLQSKTAGVADSDLVASPDKKSAVFTGHILGTTKIEATSAGLTPTMSGTITVAPGTAARVRVETKSDGTGTIVPAQSILAARSVTMYAISRDSANNFLANVAASSWSMQSVTGGVADSDLVASGDRKSAVFTGLVLGSGQVRAQFSTLTPVPSGTITVALGTVAKVRVETKADGSGIVVPDQTVPSGDSIHVYAVTRDSANNFVANVAATAWSLTGKTGSVVDGDLVAASDKKSAVFKGNELGTARAQATSGTLQVVSSGLLTVGVGAAAKLAFILEPGNAVSQVVMPPVSVMIQDINGHQVTDSRSVTLSLWNNPAGGTLGGTTTVPAVGGLATFNDLTVDKADSHYTMRATSLPALVTDTSRVFFVEPGPFVGFTVEDSASGPIPSQNAGVPFKVRITARDAVGNVAKGFNGTVNLTANGGGILGTGGGTTLAFTKGVLASHTVSFNNTGTFSLTVTNSPGVAGTSNDFGVTAGAPGKVVFVQQPSNSVAGVVISPAITVQLQDALGNNVAQSGVSIVMDLSTGTGILSGTKTRTTNFTGVASFANLFIDSAGAKRLRARSGTLTFAISDSFAISAGNASKLAFAVQPGTGNGGAPLTVQPVVSLQDQFGNTVTGKAETVTLAIQDNPSQGTLGGIRTAAINTLTGQAAFTNLFIDKAGVGYTLTATGQAVSTTPGVVVSAPFDIASGAPAKLAFSVQPSNAEAGAVITPAVVVQVQDAFGNLVSLNDTLVILAMDSSGNLAGNTSRRTIAGSATFSDLYIDKEGVKVLKATGGGFTGAVSKTFNISPGPAAKLVFTTEPGSGVAGQPLSPQPVLTLQDAYGNTAIGVAQSVTLSLKDTAAPGAKLNGVKTVSVDFAKATASFTGLSIDKTGSGYTLTAVGSTVDTARGMVVSKPLTIIAGSAKKLRIETLADGKGSVLGTQNVSSGIPISVYAIGRDSLDNFVANVAAEQWKLVDTAGGANSTDLVPASDKKSAVFTGGVTGSSARILATMTGLKADTTGKLSVVQPGPATKILVETVPNGTGTVVPAQSIASGGSLTVYSVERDAANNFVANAPAENWSLQVISGSIQQSDLVPSVDKKSALFTAHKEGKVQIVASLGTLAEVKSDTLRVVPGTPASVAVGSKSPDSARVDSYFASRLIAVVRDSSGNPVRNVLVTYSAPASGPSSSFDDAVNASTTDSLGQAPSKPIKANTVVGQYTDTARVAGIPGQALFVLRNLAGVPRTITSVSGTPQTTVVASAFPLPLTVAVRDSFGNPVDSVLVTFGAPTSGAGGTFPGGVATNSSYTNALGVATSAVFVANIVAGTYSVNATVSGVATPASFVLTNSAGAAGSVTATAGTPQSAVVATAFATRFKALVKDGAGNVVSNVLVRFTAPATGPSGTFTAGLTDTARTNASGVATASVFTADTMAGTYNLLATVDGSPGNAMFALTNVPGLVDTFIVESISGGDIPGQIAQVPFAIKVTARDMYKNVASAFTGTVTITATGALLSGGGKTASFVAGVLDSHAVRTQTAGTYLLTATRTGGAETGKSNQFQVVNPAPLVKSITPSNGLAGQTLNVVILGSGFISGVTSVTFGDQITTSTAVTNDSTLTVRITIDPAATLGPRNVIVFNAPPGGSPPYTKVGGFIIGDNAVPTVQSIHPDSAAQLRSTRMTVRGTNFLGATQVSFAPSAGITVDSMTVVDSTSITFRVSLSASAALGLHDVIVKNPPPGGGSDTLQGGLRVIPGDLRPPTLASPADGSKNQPSTLTLTWQPAIGATSYDLQVATSSTFVSGLVVNDSMLTGTSRQVGPLTVATTYFWRARSRNANGLSAWSAPWSFDNISYPATYTLNDTIDFPTYASAGAYNQTDYQLVGLPGASNASLSALIPGAAGTDWQAYWDNGGQSNYLVTFSEGEPFTFAAGRGFWIIKKGAWILRNQVVNTAPLQPSTSAVHVKLHSGWNIVTNPFENHVFWSDILTANFPFNEQIHGWKLNNGTVAGWYQSAYAEPCTGYYLYNDPANPIDTLKFPYNLSLGRATKKLATAPADSGSWRVSVGLKAGKYVDEPTSLGVSALAAEGKDRYDYHKPRPFAEIPAIYFDRPEWDRYCSTFASDIRAPFSKLGVWELTISTAGPKEGSVEMDFSGMENIPKEFGVYLIDEGGASFRNLRQEGTSYKFVPVASTVRFKLLVGTKEALDQEVAKVLPSTFALEQNYPNPFNPSTTIPVSVPRAADVTLKVYNIIGEEVATVYSGMLEPGKHRFIWEGRNNSGSPVASGVYFVRLTTHSGPSFTGKMLLMK